MEITEKELWTTHAPGADRAFEAGCTCARMDNNRGKGYMGQPGVFAISGDCPLHARTKEAEARETE